MTDNERIVFLQESIMQAINASALPLGVKSLALENVLFRVNEALKADIASSKAVPPEEVNNEQA